MGIYRTYFDKNNTLVKDSQVNTGRNQVAELWYGTKKSRLLFYCSFDELKAMVADKRLILTGDTRHVLKIKNTSNYDVSQFLNDTNDLLYSDKYKSSSFDLELKLVDELWDEGMGYDFEVNSQTIPQNRDYSTEPSNWYNRTTINTWNNNGGVNTLGTLATQHFNLGNEDVEMDITDIVNQIVSENITPVLTGNTSGGTTGYTVNYQGFCLKYTDDYENVTFNDGRTNVFGLFTRHTQTFFEPYIETYYDDTIVDDRVDCFLNKNNNLYLYVTLNGELTNLDSLPSCSISGVTQTVYQKTKGVYYVTFFANPNLFDSYTEYTDVWSGLTVNGKSIPNITMKFILKDANEYYLIGNTPMEPIKYGVSTSGIKREEKLKQGEIRRVNVLLRKPYTAQHSVLTNNVYYRLYIKQGGNQVEVLDWQKVSKSYNNNFFMLDTTWMVPQKYYIDIKIETNGEVNIHTEELCFDVVSLIK